MSSTAFRRVALLAAGATLGLATLTGTAAADTAGWTGTGDIHWMVDASALPLISGYTNNNTLVTSAFNNARTNVMGTPAAGLVPDSLPTKTYETYAAFQNAFPNLAPGSWVVYDLESWSQSAPDNTDPATYMTEFVTLAHSNPDPTQWIHVILAPALDLVQTMTTSADDCYNSADPNYQNYLTNCQIPTLVGNAQPDAYEVQSQHFEACTAAGITGCTITYQSFVQQSVAQHSPSTPPCPRWPACPPIPVARSATAQR